MVDTVTEWPAYALPEDSPPRAALLGAARGLGVAATPKIAGRSNIGNYLAGLSIPATSGFGVACAGVHGTAGRIRSDAVPTVQAVYDAAVFTLLDA